MIKDANNIRVKPGHTGHSGPDMGKKVWLLRRNDDKLFGVFTSRHEAVGAACLLDGHQEEWFTPIRVNVGSVRMDDVVMISTEGSDAT